MKLTIIHPCIGRKKGDFSYVKSWQMEPLPVAALAGLTPSDVRIEFYDDRLERIPYARPTDLVAISIETYTAKRAYQIARKYRERGVPVVMGGYHATLCPKEVQEHCDAIMIGEAEQMWPQIIEDFKKGKLKKKYLQKKRTDLSTVTYDRSLFKNKRYLPISLIESGRGCNFSCDFCAIQSFYKSSHTKRPIEEILKEVKAYRKNLIFFIDDNITADREHLIKLLKALIPLKIRWVSQASINITYDEKLLRLLQKSGCFGLLIGFESIEKETLATMNKTFNTARGGFSQAIKALRKHHIKLYPTFVFGYPHDTKQTFVKTLKFAQKHRFLIAAFNHLTPFPGTPLYNKLEQNGELLYDKWWLSDQYRYGDVPMQMGELRPEQIRCYCFSMRKRFFSIKGILRRMMDRWNVHNWYSFKTFLIMNIMFHKELKQREGFPLGDENDE